MDFYMILQAASWLAVGLMMTLFAMTGGFDFGAGILLPFVGRTNDERRVVINTVGPTWDGNQVWLIIAGASIFAIWPRVYAASFSGLYFAFMVVLWALFFRPVSFEYRSKLQSQRWRTFWDWALFAGSLLPPLIVGVGIGNLFLGLPFQFDPQSLRFFYGPTMTDSAAVMGLFGLLRPFAFFCGVVSVLMMLMHGASYLKLRTTGRVYERSCTTLRWISGLLIVAFAIGGFWVAKLMGFHWNPASNPAPHMLNNVITRSAGGWLKNYTAYPWMIVAPILAFLGGVFVFLSAKAKQGAWTFTGSCLAIFGIMATFGLSLFPFIMPSALKPAQSLVVWNSSSSEVSLLGILITAVIMLPIIFIYTTFVYRKLWGRGKRMSTERVVEERNQLY